MKFVMHFFGASVTGFIKKRKAPSTINANTKKHRNGKAVVSDEEDSPPTAHDDPDMDGIIVVPE
jgi:hypothetical protein